MATISTINKIFGHLIEVSAFVDKWVDKSAKYLSPGVDSVTGEVRKPVELEPLVVPLGLSFGNLKTGETLAKLDEYTKMLIAVVCMVVEKIPEKEKTYDTVLAALLQNPLIEAVSGSDTSKEETFETTKKRIFNLKGSVDPAIVRQANAWVENFVGDDVLAATHLDTNALAAVVAQTGAVITGLQDIIAGTQENVRPAINIGVIQFPDNKQPDFKLYRIDLTAWSRCERTGPVETNNNGIRGSFYTRSVTLRKTIVENLSDEKKQKLITKGAEIFD